MKKLNFIALIVMGALLFSCGEPSQSAKSESVATTGEDSQPDMTGMQMINLTDYDIPATIYVPDESKGKRTITATEWGSVQILSGKKYGIEIVPFGMTISEKKEELNNASVYTIEIISEDANSIIYSKAINGTELEPEMHFFVSKELNGDSFEIKSLDKSYTKLSIEKMVNSAATFTAAENS